MTRDGIRPLRSDWQGIVLVCGKCSRKAGGGFGEKGRTPLAKLLRKVWGKGRKARRGVVETKCLGICPKHGVVVVDGAAPGRWLIIPPGSDDAALAALLPDADAKPQAA